MHLTPYIEVTGVPFGAAETLVLSNLGAAHRRTVDYLGRLELAFEARAFRFSAQTGLFVEATLCSEYFQIDGCALPGAKGGEAAFVELGFTVAKLDADSFERNGFIVSPRFGVAFDPHHAPFLTAFARSELPEWSNGAALLNHTG